MIERDVKIKTKGGHIIYGVLSDKGEEPSKALVVFVHGLASSMHEHKYYNAARLFAKNGVATFRFNLYDSSAGGRNILDCDLATHASDVDTVLKHFRKRYNEIFLVGHSLGALVIMLADMSLVSGVIFWDGTHRESTHSFMKKAFSVTSKDADAFIVNWGATYLIPKVLIEGDLPSSRDMIRRVTVPLKLIYAGKGILVKGAKDYYTNANEPKELVFIKGADHNFDKGETAAELHKETLSFVKKYSK